MDETITEAFAASNPAFLGAFGTKILQPGSTFGYFLKNNHFFVV